MNTQSSRIAITLAVFWAAYLLYGLATQSAALSRIGGPRRRSHTRRTEAGSDSESGAASLVIARRVVGGTVLGGVPAVAALFLQMTPRDIGLCGSGPLSPGFAMAAMATLVPLMILLSRSREARATYPLIRAARWSLGLLAANAVSWAYLLAGYELCVRGFLLLALARAAGDAAAIAMATVVYSAVHLPRGRAETLGSIPIGVAFAWLTLRTGTIWAAWLGHLLIACTTEAACLLRARRDLAPAGVAVSCAARAAARRRSAAVREEV